MNRNYIKWNSIGFKGNEGSAEFTRDQTLKGLLTWYLRIIKEAFDAYYGNVLYQVEE